MLDRGNSARHTGKRADYVLLLAQDSDAAPAPGRPQFEHAESPPAGAANPLRNSHTSHYAEPSTLAPGRDTPPHHAGGLTRHAAPRDLPTVARPAIAQTFAQNTAPIPVV